MCSRHRPALPAVLTTPHHQRRTPGITAHAFAAAAADHDQRGASPAAAALDEDEEDAQAELHAVDTAIRANIAIFCAKMAVYMISSSRWANTVREQKLCGLRGLPVNISHHPMQSNRA